MKRGTPRHPKIGHLCELLHIGLPLAIGYLELLWHFTAEFAPQGNIGKFDDRRIEAALSYGGHRGRLVEALVDAGWVDRHPTHRLVVHDWDAHADDAVRKRLNRAGLPFLSNQPVEPKVTGHRQTSADNVSLPEPEPEPEPEPCQSQSPAGPEPHVTATSSSASSAGLHANVSGDDAAAGAFVARVRGTWLKLNIACGPWTSANDRIARHWFHLGKSFDETERTMLWGAAMHFKHSHNSGDQSKIASLEYFATCADNDQLQATSTQQLQHMVARCEREARGAA